MKTTVKLLTLFICLNFGVGYSQNFQGVATYKTMRALDFKIDSNNTNVNSEMQKKMHDMLKKQFQKTFKLSFNKEASVYKEEESLDKPQVGSSDGMVIKVMGNGGSDILYKNTKENKFVYQRDTYGKLFLVKDDIEKLDWKLGAETKYIGEYLCYKATYTKMVEKPRQWSSEDKDTPDLDAEPEMEERTVTAWYTLQVPVNNGPDEYQGLPGLILEVHDGKLTIVCSKIVMNPQNKVAIKEPTKGKEVTQEKYEAIMEKKAKEMMERYAPKKGNRGGESFTIQIGG